MALDEEGQRRIAPGSLERTEAEEAVRCRACGHALARARDATEVEGKHVHVFVNPSAIEFTLGCFRDAPGCAAWGKAETFWGWFRGYAWRVAVCGACTAHVGWSFEGVSSSFYGLILERVAQ